MSTTRPFIDPEVAVLLGEIIQDPDAQLFTATDPSKLAGAAGLVSPMSIRQAGLTVAERHLLQMYRQEAAWLLRQAALTRLYEDPKNALILEKSVTVDRDIELLDGREWTRRVARVREQGALDEVPEECWVSPRQVAAGRGAQASVELLCESSCRLVPSDEARIYLAFSANRAGRHEDAAKGLQAVLSSRPTELNASYSWENLGFLYSNTKHLGRALDAYKRGALTSERRPAGVLQWLHMAVRASSEPQVLHAAAVLDEMIAPDHSAVDDDFSRRMALGTSLTDPMRSVVARVRDRFGRTSRRATDVYFKS